MEAQSNKDILNYLMTSDFNEDYKPEHLKDLLRKFRNFYRVLYDKNKNISDSFLSENELLKKDLQRTEKLLDEEKRQVTILEADYKKIVNRKLTLRERLSGKIILKDEDRRI